MKKKNENHVALIENPEHIQINVCDFRQVLAIGGDSDIGTELRSERVRNA